MNHRGVQRRKEDLDVNNVNCVDTVFSNTEETPPSSTTLRVTSPRSVDVQVQATSLQGMDIPCVSDLLIDDEGAEIAFGLIYGSVAPGTAIGETTRREPNELLECTKFGDLGFRLSTWTDLLSCGDGVETDLFSELTKMVPNAIGGGESDSAKDQLVVGWWVVNVGLGSQLPPEVAAWLLSTVHGDGIVEEHSFSSLCARSNPHSLSIPPGRLLVVVDGMKIGSGSRRNDTNGDQMNITTGLQYPMFEVYDLCDGSDISALDYSII